jgi:hypothetical protein
MLMRASLPCASLRQCEIQLGYTISQYEFFDSFFLNKTEALSFIKIEEQTTPSLQALIQLQSWCIFGSSLCLVENFSSPGNISTLPCIYDIFFEACI